MVHDGQDTHIVLGELPLKRELLLEQSGPRCVFVVLCHILACLARSLVRCIAAADVVVACQGCITLDCVCCFCPELCNQLPQ